MPKVWVKSLALSDALLRIRTSIERVVACDPPRGSTGIHHQHWARHQVVDYFHENSSEDEPTVQSETDRYIAQPAQALAYKIGEQTILDLRRQAQSALGPRFRIPDFHDQVLGAESIRLTFFALVSPHGLPTKQQPLINCRAVQIHTR